MIAGGPTATHPEPVAPFIDAAFIGDAEEQLPAARARVGRAARARSARASARACDALAELASRFPLYVPSLYATERRRRDRA